MPQAVKIVSQSKEQGLPMLCQQATARSTARQFVFGHGEHGFNQRAATVFVAGEVSAHLGTNAMNSPRLLAALGGDDAESMKLLTNKGVITLGVELGIGLPSQNAY